MRRPLAAMGFGLIYRYIGSVFRAAETKRTFYFQGHGEFGPGKTFWFFRVTKRTAIYQITERPEHLHPGLSVCWHSLVLLFLYSGLFQHQPEILVKLQQVVDHFDNLFRQGR